MKFLVEMVLEVFGGWNLLQEAPTEGSERVWGFQRQPEEANKAGHNGPRGPPEGHSRESWDHLGVKIEGTLVLGR